MKNALLYFLVASGITASAFYATRTLTTNNDDVYESFQSTMSEYCETEVKHLGIDAETASAILLTIENVDDKSMIVVIESANDDPVDDLILNNSTGPITGAPAISEIDNSVPGKLSRTLTWTDAAPRDVELNVLWSKESFAGNWQLIPGPDNITVPFEATCDEDGGGDPTDPVMSEYCETEVRHLGIEAEVASAILLTIENVDEFSMIVEIESANDDPVDDLIVNNSFGPITGSPAISEIDRSIPGKLSRTLTWANTIVTDVELNVLWSKESNPGNWQLVPIPDPGNITVPFEATCEDDGGGNGGGGVAGMNIVDFPIDFECEFTEYTFIEFNGAPTIVVDNPDASGINTSGKVAQMTKVQDAADFAGVILTLEDPIDFSKGQVFKMKTWSPKVGATVKLKLENLNDGGIANEIDATTTVGNTWEELTFDFSGTDASNKSLQKVIVFFDFGNFGDGSVYYFDDIIQDGNNDVIACEDPNGGGDIVGTNIVDFPIDFECEFTEYTFIEFNGAPTVVVDNPDASGINTSDKVAQTTKVQDAADFAGSFLTLENPIDFSKGQVFTIKTWSPKVGATVKLKLENLTDGGIANEIDAMTSVANAWEELTFDFSGTDASSKSLQKVIIFFDFGNFGDGSVYYWDDVIQVGNDDIIACEDPNSGGGGDVANVVDFPIDFECEFTEYTFNEFGGAPTVVVDNPDASGINTSAKVAEMTKVQDAADFAGVILTLEDPIDFSKGQVFKMKTWSPKIGATVKLKLENLTDGSIANEIDATTTVGSTWEELTFDFSGTDANSKSLQKVIVFFDFGNFGDGTVYYFDDIIQDGNDDVIACEDPDGGNVAGTNIVDFPIDFECEFTAYAFQEFGGAPTVLIDNPDASGINTSAKVAQMTKVQDAADFAGVILTLEDPIDFSKGQVFKIKTWSPKVGATVKLKLENLNDGGIANEIDATTTVGSTWEELTFDFSGTDANSKSLQKVIVFFDFGNFGDGSIYYFDDIIQEGNDDVIACEDPGSGGGVDPNSIVFPVDFECEFIENYIAVDFEGTFTQVIDNPFAEGINTSPKVAQTVKGNGAATFAGTIINLAESIDFNISKVFTVKVRSPRANVLVKMKLEQTGNGAIANEIDAFTTVADQWEELTFDFSGTDASNAKMLQSIVIFFDFGNVGDGASYFFDDIVQVGNTGMTDCQAPTEPSEDAFRPPVCETAIAVYSNAYEQQVSNLNINAFAGSTILSEVQIDGNDIFRYDNFDFQGIQFDPLDASESTNLHVDVWSVDLDQIRIFPISPGPAEKPYELNLVRGEWNRFDIPLSEFSDVVDLSNIFQFKFDGGTGTETVFIDNLYVNGECYIAPECAQLVWADEFNGTSLNLDDWTYELGDGCPELCGWGNQELQFYREENTTVADGKLTITAKEESFGGYEYTSSRIVTKGKQDFTYGRMEASIKVPEGQGIWPAFWMFHSNGEYGVWPLSGEIDIMEYLGQETDRIFGTIHHGDLFPNNRNTSGDFRLVQGGFNEEFYEYAIEWEENVIRWYVNDYLYLTLTPEDIAPDPWAFNQDFHFLLNVAVGGTLPGNPDDSTVFPQTMEVDYVRVYKGRFPHLTGAQRVDFMTAGEIYTVNNGGPGSTYNWTVVGGTIIDGQGTSEITVDWAGASKDAMVSVDVTNDCGVESTINLNVEIDIERVSEKEFSFENFDDEALVEFLFSNGAYEDNVANPAPDALNSSALVGKYTRDANTQFDVIVYGTEAIPDASEYTSGSKSFFIDIYTDAPIGTPILLQLENSTEAEPSNFPTGRHSRYETKTTVQNAWQRLAFEFKDRPDGSTSDLGIDQIIILFNSNTFTGDMFFYDNLDKYCTDGRDKCFDDMDISMTDPCNCDNPNNITLDSGRFLFEDVLKVDASSFTNPVVTLVSQNGNLFDANGDRYTTETAQFVDLGGGIFGLQYFTRYVSPATIVIDVNGQQKEFTTASCLPCSGTIAEDVPTMSEWGLLIFGLFMMNVGLVFMYRMRNSYVVE